MADKPIGIADLIEQVKRDLLRSHNTKDPVFLMDKVELEIAFTVEGSVEGGIDLKVVKAGAGVKETTVQTVKVTLEMVATPAKVRDELTPDEIKKAAEVAKRRADF